MGTPRAPPGYRWIIDPIDGTPYLRSPVSRSGATLVGLEYQKDEQILGVAVSARHGLQTYRAPCARRASRFATISPIRVSPVAKLATTGLLLIYSEPLLVHEKAGRQEQFIDLTSARTQKQARVSATSMAFLLCVAVGSAPRSWSSMACWRLGRGRDQTDRSRRRAAISATGRLLDALDSPAGRDRQQRSSCMIEVLAVSSTNRLPLPRPRGTGR